MVVVLLQRLHVVRGSAQSDVFYWIYGLKTTQNGPNWVLNQNNVVLLLGKVENSKYKETKTWHPESVEECSYYRPCENF